MAVSLPGLPVLRAARDTVETAARGWLRRRFWGPPTFGRFFLPALVVAFLVFSRSPGSNYIFDEQEALLANPYLAGEVRWLDVFRRDFWGLPPHASIGSYRPLPNVIWRSLWWPIQRLPVLKAVGPWLVHCVNVIGHAAVAACLASFAWKVSGARRVGWATGFAFLLSAVLTEAVTGVVGLADVLAGLGVVLALQALRLPLLAMPLGVFAALCFGFGGKESTLAAVPLIGLAALVTAPSLHAARPLTALRGCVGLLGAVAALVAFTELRKACFPAPLPPELTQAPPEGWAGRLLHDFLTWFHQPKLPRDPINNPLLEASTPRRINGGFHVYGAGLVQLLFPWSLSGDYSFAQMPIPHSAFAWRGVAGALCFLALLATGGCWLLRTLKGAPSPEQTKAACLIGLGLVWVPLAYLPHSNLLVSLPTVRAERFWYLPALGSSLVLGVVMARLMARRRAWAWAVVAAFFGLQTLQARAHALHYSDDLVFWRATRSASPSSAKAHLNYSIMVGARGDPARRLAAGAEALRLAPHWGMAHVYQGDALCRMGRLDEAWQHYERGFMLDPNSRALAALALQCLWDKGAIEKRGERLLELSERFPRTWLAYLASDVVRNGAVHGGVDPQYRPRSYEANPAR